MKLNIFDIRLLKSTGTFIMLEGSILSVVAIFFNDYIIDKKIYFIIGILVVAIVYHIMRWKHLRKSKELTLKIKNSTFKIISGDIFRQEGLKVINFNEYFDTLVDDKVIARNSLNGQFILNKVNNVEELDKIISLSLKNTNIGENKKKKSGKKVKYELGSIVEYNDYLLTALTKFDDDNRANLSLKDYLVFLMNFWDSLDKIYANRSVCITLFGSSSLTRFKDTNDITDKDLIEIIIWSLKVSKIKFKYPTTISLVLTDDIMSKINLYELKERYKNGI